MYEAPHMYVRADHSRLQAVDIVQMLSQDKAMSHLYRSGIVCKSSTEEFQGINQSTL